MQAVQDYLDLLYLWLWLLLSPDRHHSQENNPTVQLLQLRQTRLWYLHFQAEGLSFQAGEGGQCFQNLAFQFQQFQKFWNRIRKSQSGMIFEQNFWIWMLETKSSVWRQRELSISIWPVNQKNCTFFFQAYIWCMHFNCMQSPTFLSVVFVQIEFRVRDRLALKRNGEKWAFVCKKNLVKFKCVKF